MREFSFYKLLHRPRHENPYWQYWLVSSALAPWCICATRGGSARWDRKELFPPETIGLRVPPKWAKKAWVKGIFQAKKE